MTGKITSLENISIKTNTFCFCYVSSSSLLSLYTLCNIMHMSTAPLWKTLLLKETHSLEKDKCGVERHKSMEVNSTHLTYLCLFCLNEESVDLLEVLSRAAAPSSIRHSQQPFLVLDGAVRMHRLIERPGLAFFLQENRGTRPERCLHP